jgi:peptidoglycan L-alanyl-D-glutamate endopeptidase CwlK
MAPKLLDLFFKFKDECDRRGIKFIVTCTTRTLEEQKELVKQGKSRTLQSKHLDGKAFDIAILENGKVTWDFDDYKEAGQIGKSVGLQWGGDFKDLPDGPHFQLP